MVAEITLLLIELLLMLLVLELVKFARPELVFSVGAFAILGI